MHASATLKTIYNLVPFFAINQTGLPTVSWSCTALLPFTTLLALSCTQWFFHAGGRWRAVEETQHEERPRGQAQEESQKSAQVDVR